MRNLKKLFAVIMVVAMLASVMVPAFAADYESDALKLKALGLFKGYSDTNLGLEDNLTREQGLTFMLRARGLEDEVTAMSAEEIAAQLAKVTDLDTVTEWAKPYVAYAVKNGLTKGIDSSVAPNVKFAGQLLLTGKEFINFMLNSMGYEEDWGNVLTKAADVGMLTAGQAVTFGTINELKRDTAAGIIGFAMGGTTASGVTLAQALVDAGAVDADAMAEAGYFTPTVAPTEAPVELAATASTDNLIQIYVEFSQEVDKTSAEDEDNYTVSDSKVDSAVLQEDGVTVVLTLKNEREQQDVADLTIKNVKDLAEVAMEELTLEVEFLDTDIPVVLDATVVGNDTFKVVFSEPMNPEFAEDKAGYVVNGGKLYVKNVELQKNNTEAMVTMYSTLKEGDVTLQIKSIAEDYAGFGVIGKLFTLSVVPDEEAPVVIGCESAKRGEVKLIWSEDIVINATTDDDGALVNADALKKYYHTNGSNTASKVTKDGNIMTITFDEEEWLPAGTAYVYVLKEAVKDLWDNKNAQEMIKVEVEVDSEPPVATGVTVKYIDDAQDAHRLEVKFDEALKKSTVEDDENYTILDSDGEEVENIIDDIDGETAKKAIIDLYEELAGGDYVLIIEDVEDVYGNAMPETVIAFTVGDIKAPKAEDFTAILYNAGEDGQMVKINFGEKMAIEGKYAVNDVEKYVINDYVLADIDDVEINVVDDGKAIEILIPKEIKLEVDDAEDVDEIKIARVADAAGNYMAELTDTINMTTSVTISISTAKATGTKKLEVKFADNVAKFDVEDILVSTSNSEVTATAKVYELEIAEVDTALSSGKTVVTFTLDDAMEYDLRVEPVYVHIIGEESENIYGQKLNKGQIKEVEDKIGPKKDKVEFVDGTTNSTITITFTEKLNNEKDYRLAYDLVVKNKDGDTLVADEDYITYVDGTDKAKLIIEVRDVTNLDKYTVETKSTITYIKDEVGDNKAATFDRVRNSN